MDLPLFITRAAPCLLVPTAAATSPMPSLFSSLIRATIGPLACKINVKKKINSGDNAMKRYIVFLHYSLFYLGDTLKLKESVSYIKLYTVILSHFPPYKL